MTRDEFLVLVMLELPACPAPLIMQTASIVMDEFCIDTGAWVETIYGVSTYAEQDTTSLFAPAGALIHGVLSVSGNGRAIHPGTRQEIARVNPNWASATGASPQFFELNSAGDLWLWPTPTETVELTVLAKLTNKPLVDSLPDGVMRTERMTIANGTKARLMAMDQKPWTNQQMSAYYENIFQSKKSAALNRVLHAGGSGDIIIRPVRFGS